MKQDYFIVVLAHSLHGKIRRIHIPLQVVYGILAFSVLGCFSLFGFVSSYARMAWKVANYNALRREADGLRVRYQNLQKVVNQTNEQLATLQLFASEVSVAYGIKRTLEGPDNLSAEGRLLPTFSETVEEYRFLRSSRLSKFDRNFARLLSENSRPSLWPVDGRLMDHFGKRIDPFSGEGAYHTGVDIAAQKGAVVRATADGVVNHAGYSGGYGRLVVVEHGGGVATYYAHLSRIDVIDGQEIRRGETVGLVGSSGRSTAPHLHYEVRNGGAPVNPYHFLTRVAVVQTAKKDLPF